VSYTLCLLTASFLAGGPDAAPPTTTNATPAPAVQPAVPGSPVETPPRPLTLRDRLRKLFGAKQDSTTPTASPAPIRQTVITTNPPPVRSTWQDAPAPLPRKTEPAVVNSTTVLGPNLAAATPHDLDKAGHEKDYSWITGRLARDNGRWIIRYAGPNEVDRFGGRLVLTGKADMSRVHEGDLVCVVGHVVNSGVALRGGPAVVYQVGEINLVERAR
jgi:hypothetical protein